MSEGYLVLENGKVFAGKILGKERTVMGEAVFNTSMNGYQEIITDPSYAGQILVFTYPQIGNYGFSDYAFESDFPALQGMVVKEASVVSGHYQSRWNLFEFIEKYGITCLSGIDTRAVTRTLRKEGTMGAVITRDITDLEAVKLQAAAGGKLLETDLVGKVSVKDVKVFGSGSRKIVLWDFGTKKSIIKSLVKSDCTVFLVPARSSAEMILRFKPDGVVLSNGPGDPRSCSYAVKEIRKLVKKLPVFGICLGHQLLALALGAETYKLTFGHRGGNHTVKDIRTGKCYVTSQNHGYAVSEKSLENTGLSISFINLNDHTVEGLHHRTLPLMSVQFHPEASPGPQETGYLFSEFLRLN